MGQWWAGCECVLHMDPEERRHLAREHMMVIMNHKYEIDWLMAWILAERIRMLGVRLKVSIFLILCSTEGFRS